MWGYLGSFSFQFFWSSSASASDLLIRGTWGDFLSSFCGRNSKFCVDNMPEYHWFMIFFPISKSPEAHGECFIYWSSGSGAEFVCKYVQWMLIIPDCTDCQSCCFPLWLINVPADCETCCTTLYWCTTTVCLFYGGRIVLFSVCILWNKVILLTRSSDSNVPWFSLSSVLDRWIHKNVST